MKTSPELYKVLGFVEKLRFDSVAAEPALSASRTGVSPAKRGATDTVATTESLCAAKLFNKAKMLLENDQVRASAVCSAGLLICSAVAAAISSNSDR